MPSLEANPLAGSPTHKPLGYARVQACALLGLRAHVIAVEASVTRGPPSFQMVGLPEAPVREAKVRMVSALACLGVLVDEYAITVNLAPADLPKTGATFDLALAAAVLAAIGKLPPHSLNGWLLLGELSLDGCLQPMRGVLPQLHGALTGTPPPASESRPATAELALPAPWRAIVPQFNRAEAGLTPRGEVYAAATLEAALGHISGRVALRRAVSTAFAPREHAASCGREHRDLSQVHGQPAARRAVEIAAAGQHNLLMVGPPGAGKTLLARLLPTILPPLEFEEALEATSIHSVAGLIRSEKGIVDLRPFRAPHHSVSEAGLVGGGTPPRPGEVSLAHNGVLFLDELPEFRRNALKALRQPLEDGEVWIARSRARAHFPARPLVVAAMNPCPCGFLGHPRESCRCSAPLLNRYRHKLSGPLLDRLDLHVRLPPVQVQHLSAPARSEDSATVRARVLAARKRQLQRYAAGHTSRRTNGELSLEELRALGALNSPCRKLLESASNQLGLSARAFVKVLRVARTVADLAGATNVTPAHLAEAIQGRILD